MNRLLFSLIMISRICGVIGVFWVAGCKLIDQRTFDPNAGKPPRLPPPPPHAPPAVVPPLIVIPAGTPKEQWQAPVDNIVQQALARKRSVLFMVHCVVPQTNSLATEQTSLFKSVQGTGLAVMQNLRAIGVPEAQIELSTMTNPTIKKPVIQVFVR